MEVDHVGTKVPRLGFKVSHCVDNSHAGGVHIRRSWIATLAEETDLMAPSLELRRNPAEIVFDPPFEPVLAADVKHAHPLRI